MAVPEFSGGQQQQFSRYFRRPVHRSNDNLRSILADADIRQQNTPQTHGQLRPQNESNPFPPDHHLHLQHSAVCQHDAGNYHRNLTRVQNLRLCLGDPGFGQNCHGAGRVGLHAEFQVLQCGGSYFLCLG